MLLNKLFPSSLFHSLCDEQELRQEHGSETSCPFQEIMSDRPTDGQTDRLIGKFNFQ